MHQNGEGRKTRGGEKNYSAPVSQKERGESRYWIPEKFRSTYNKLQCTCQNGVTTPLSCHVNQKKTAFMHTPSLPSAYAFLLYPISSLGRPALDALNSPHGYQRSSKYSHQGAILCPSKCTKMHIIASDFSKISRGSMPPDPLAGLGRSPSFCRLYAS